MTDKPADKDFLARWSDRKRGAAVAEEDGSTGVIPDAGIVATVGVDEADEAVVADVPPVDLPDIETLEAGSDFTAFLGDNVPKGIAKLAFRKLWRSDPVLANIDGLNDYDDDYSLVGNAVEIIKSVYQVGKGYVSEAEENLDEDSPDDASDSNPEEQVPVVPEELSVSTDGSSLTGIAEGAEELETTPTQQPSEPSP